MNKISNKFSLQIGDSKFTSEISNVLLNNGERVGTNPSTIRKQNLEKSVKDNPINLYQKTMSWIKGNTSEKENKTKEVTLYAVGHLHSKEAASKYINVLTEKSNCVSANGVRY